MAMNVATIANPLANGAGDASKVMDWLKARFQVQDAEGVGKQLLDNYGNSAAQQDLVQNLTRDLGYNNIGQTATSTLLSLFNIGRQGAALKGLNQQYAGEGQADPSRYQATTGQTVADLLGKFFSGGGNVRNAVASAFGAPLAAPSSTAVMAGTAQPGLVGNSGGAVIAGNSGGYTPGQTMPDAALQLASDPAKYLARLNEAITNPYYQNAIGPISDNTITSAMSAVSQLIPLLYGQIPSYQFQTPFRAALDASYNGQSPLGQLQYVLQQLARGGVRNTGY